MQDRLETTTEQTGFEALFFDVDGTLWDTAACNEHVMQIALAKLAPHLPDQEPEELIRHFNASLLELAGKYGLTSTRIFSSVGRFEELLKLHGAREPKLVHELAHTFDAARRLTMRSFLMEGAENLLKKLRSRDITVGVMVNGPPAICRQTLKTLGVGRYIQLSIIGGVEGYSKPDPRLFGVAAERAGVSPGQILYVGDSPITDLKGACEAGVPVAWLRYRRRRLPERFPSPDFIISRLPQLLDILRRRS